MKKHKSERTNTDIKEHAVEFVKLSRGVIKAGNYNPGGGWAFNWLKSFSQGYDVYALVLKETPNITEGLIALNENHDPDFMCVDVDIIESAPHNKKISNGKINSSRKLEGVGKMLVAFACKYSMDNGLDGYVELTSKSSKIPFYKELGAERASGHNFIFNTYSATKLVSEYFKGGV